MSVSTQIQDFERDDIVVICGDARHRKGVVDALAAVSVDLAKCDLLAWAGGLASASEMMDAPPSKTPSPLDNLIWIHALDQVFTYARLHELECVYIILSPHCGKYGGHEHVTDEQRKHAERFKSSLKVNEDLALKVTIIEAED